MRSGGNKRASYFGRLLPHAKRLFLGDFKPPIRQGYRISIFVYHKVKTCSSSDSFVRCANYNSHHNTHAFLIDAAAE